MELWNDLSTISHFVTQRQFLYQIKPSEPILFIANIILVRSEVISWKGWGVVAVGALSSIGSEL